MQLEPTSRNYERISILHRGRFGCVLLVRSRASNKLYAVKQSNLSNQTEEDRLRILSEVDIICKLQHPYIARCKEAQLLFGSLWLVLEYAPGGDLKHFLRQNDVAHYPLSEATLLRFAIQLSSALAYIHKKGFVHRDIKSANVLVFDKLRLKIGDFGMAKQPLDRSMLNTLVGTPEYLSPEMCRGEPYNSKTDVWSLGCVLSEIANGVPPFKGGNLSTIMTEICSGDVPYCRPGYTRWVTGLIRSMMHPYQSIRPEAIAIEELFRAGQNGNPEVVNIQNDASNTAESHFEPGSDGQTTHQTAQNVFDRSNTTEFASLTNHGSDVSGFSTAKSSLDSLAIYKNKPASKSGTLGEDQRQGKSKTSNGVKKGNSIKKKIQNSLRPAKDTKTTSKKKNTAVGEDELVDGNANADSLGDNPQNTHRGVYQTQSGSLHVSVGDARYKITKNIGQAGPRSTSTLGCAEDDDIYGLLFGGFEGELGSALTDEPTYTKLRVNLKSDLKQQRRGGKTTSTLSKRAHLRTGRDHTRNQVDNVEDDLSSPNAECGNGEAEDQTEDADSVYAASEPVFHGDCAPNRDIDTNYLVWNDIKDSPARACRTTSLPGSPISAKVGTREIPDTNLSVGLEFDIKMPHRRASYRARTRGLSKTDASVDQEEMRAPPCIPRTTQQPVMKAHDRSDAAEAKTDDSLSLPTPSKSIEDALGSRARKSLRSVRSATKPTVTTFRRDDSNMQTLDVGRTPTHKREPDDNSDTVYENITRINRPLRDLPMPAVNNKHERAHKRAGSHASLGTSASRLGQVNSIVQHIEKEETRLHNQQQANSNREQAESNPPVVMSPAAGRDVGQQMSSNAGGRGRVFDSKQPEFSHSSSGTWYTQDINLDDYSDEYYDPEIEFCDHCSGDHTPQVVCESRPTSEGIDGDLQPRSIRLDRDDHKGGDTTKEMSQCRYPAPYHGYGSSSQADTLTSMSQQASMKKTTTRSDDRDWRHTSSAKMNKRQQTPRQEPTSHTPRGRTLVPRSTRTPPASKRSFSVEQENEKQSTTYPVASVRPISRSVSRHHEHRLSPANATRGETHGDKNIRPSRSNRSIEQPVQSGTQHSRGQHDRAEYGKGSESGNFRGGGHHQERRRWRDTQQIASPREEPQRTGHSYSGFDAIQPESPELYRFLCESMGEPKVLSAISFLRELPISALSNEALTNAVLKVLQSIIGEENERFAALLLEMVIPGQY